MRRGEIWTASGGKDYAGKPRPIVIVQDDAFDTSASVTVCGFTTNPGEAPLFRLDVAATDDTGLAEDSRLMVDKLTTIPRTKLGKRIGRLSEPDVVRLNRAIMVFLGLAGSSQGEAAE